MDFFALPILQKKYEFIMYGLSVFGATPDVDSNSRHFGILEQAIKTKW